MENRRGQASAELMILLAAVFAFLLLFLPVISSARQRVDFLVVRQAQDVALQKIADSSNEVYSMGKGSRLSGTIFFAEDSEISFAPSSSGELQFSLFFSHAGRNATVYKRAPFQNLLKGDSVWQSESFARGNHEFAVENSGQGGIALSIT